VIEPVSTTTTQARSSSSVIFKDGLNESEDRLSISQKL
jgi:hypothetical protein